MSEFYRYHELRSALTAAVDKAEVIVIKTDYLSHAQWYRVVRRAKAKGKKIVYCRNNVELVFRKIGELV